MESRKNQKQQIKQEINLRIQRYQNTLPIPRRDDVKLKRYKFCNKFLVQ